MRFATVGALFLLPQCVAGQSRLDELQVGARVRIEAPSVVAGRYEAVVRARRGDTLVLASDGKAPLTLALSAVSRAELYAGKSALAGARRGAIRGAIVGAAFGALGAAGAAENYGGAADFFADVAICAGIGALTGRAIRADRWKRLQ